ncbi:MAG: hypothetical protein ABIJ52_16440 [Pseudomonadota bacterium]
MNTKVCLIILASVFGLMIVGAIIGNILESSGTLETVGLKGITAIKLTYFVLFCIMGFTLVPIVLRYFIAMQIKIGNGEFVLIKWIRAHEQTVIYGFWSMFIIGLFIAVSAAIKSGFFK